MGKNVAGGTADRDYSGGYVMPDGPAWPPEGGMRAEAPRLKLESTHRREQQNFAHSE
jgi:hypothetical protein